MISVVLKLRNNVMQICFRFKTALLHKLLFLKRTFAMCLGLGIICCFGLALMMPDCWNHIFFNEFIAYTYKHVV